MNTPYITQDRIMQIIADYPAYTIYAEDPAREFADGDVFAIPFQTRQHGTLYRFYTLGSVASYAKRYNKDPVKAVTDAVDRGHALYWANQNATSLTAHKRAKEVVPGFEVGDTIKFEGHTFVLVAAPNNNISLRLV